MDLSVVKNLQKIMDLSNQIGERALKFRYRSLQQYRSHKKIFSELGDTALQSWTNFGKSGEISWLLVDSVDPRACCWPKVVETEFWSVTKKVFDFISIAKSDLSNWYYIHAYFIEIQMMEKSVFFHHLYFDKVCVYAIPARYIAFCYRAFSESWYRDFPI